MTVILYDLGDAAGRPVSPYGWRVREALHLLAIPFESRLLSLSEIRRTLTGANRTVPVLLEGDQETGDSWRIVRHLARHRDTEGRLFGGPGGYPLAAFVTHWVDAAVMAPLNRMIVKDVHDGLQAEDRTAFRTNQESKLGVTLERTVEEREGLRPAFQISLHPARQAIRDRPFISGERPAYGDFVLHSAFQWSRAVSTFELLRTEDRLRGWIQRMDDWLAVADK